MRYQPLSTPWGLSHIGDRWCFDVDYIAEMFLVRAHPELVSGEEFVEFNNFMECMNTLPVEQHQAITVSHDLDLLYTRKYSKIREQGYPVLGYFRAYRRVLRGYYEGFMYLGSEPDTSYIWGVETLAKLLFGRYYPDKECPKYIECYSSGLADDSRVSRSIYE